MGKEGDVSRRRRLFGSVARIAWYAYYRTIRFADSDFKCHHHGEEETMTPADANKLLEHFENKQELEKFNLPFPMGVFGTLREGRSNNHRMYNGKPVMHSKAFLPHFIAHGLSISFEKDATAPFEIFFYEEKEWNKMIPSVDALEGFNPKYVDWNEDWGYHRTLAWLYILPKEYNHPIYKKDLGGYRNLQIPKKEWNNYEKIPAWIYSSIKENNLAKKQTNSIIWG